MEHDQNNSTYPRPVTSRERTWIEWILPADRSGYRKYRDLLTTMEVIGDGRRGAGEIILGLKNDKPNFDDPLAPVIAYGTIETNFGPISVTFRDPVDNQISVEIVSQRMDHVPAEFEEYRRWTYSEWKPGIQCPQCRNTIREIPMHSGESGRFVLAVCHIDKRLWVYEEATQLIRLIPVTNYYNELMLHKNIRDPKIALDSGRLFSHLSQYSDTDLTYAFFTYNKIKAKVRAGGLIQPDKKEKPGISGTLRRIFSKHTS